MGVTIFYRFPYTVVRLASCHPIRFNWDRTITGGRCNDPKSLTSQMIGSLILDVVVVDLPMPMLRGLEMKLQRKIAIMCIFGMGLLICIISAVRVLLNPIVVPATDFTFYIGQSSLLALLGANFSITTACLPLLQPVATLLSSRFKSMSRRTRGSRSPTLRDRVGSPAKNSSRNISSSGGFGDAKYKRLSDSLCPSPYEGKTQVGDTDIKAGSTYSSEGSGLQTWGLQRATKKEQNAIVEDAWKVSSDSIQ